jgi:hypothetical protein
MDHTKHVRLSQSELTDDNLQGATVYGGEDHKVSSVDHIDGSDLVLTDVGGFLGIGSKPLAVPFSDLDWMRDENGGVHAVTGWTKDQLKPMPERRD